MPQQTTTTFAAPAPAAIDVEPPMPDTQPGEPSNDHLHDLCEQFAAWHRTRRFYGRMSVPVSLLGRLASKTRPTKNAGGPDAMASSLMMALHLAYVSQPVEALDRQVFELYYLVRVKNIKAAAGALGISRAHWYRVLVDFRRRIYAAACEMEREATTQGRVLLKSAT